MLTRAAEQSLEKTTRMIAANELVMTGPVPKRSRLGIYHAVRSDPGSGSAIPRRRMSYRT